MNYEISAIYYEGGLEQFISFIIFHRGTCAGVLDRKLFFHVSVFLRRTLKKALPVTPKPANLPYLVPPLCCWPPPCLKPTHIRCQKPSYY